MLHGIIAISLHTVCPTWLLIDCNAITLTSLMSASELNLAIADVIGDADPKLKIERDS